MKRAVTALLIAVLLLQTCSCIQIVDGGYHPAATEDTTTQTNRVPTFPESLVYPAWGNAEGTAKAFLDLQGAVVDTSEREYSYAEMTEDLAILKSRYPSLMEYYSIGKTVVGRELYVVRVGNPDAGQQIVVSAGIHGREYLTPLLAMKQLEFLLAYYNTGSCGAYSYATLLEQVCFYIVPMSNPDGIMLSQEGIGSISDRSLYDKIYSVYYKDFEEKYTKQTDINEYLKIWKSNANAVDLNRNFDAGWSKVDTGIDRPSHKNYKGGVAASEPETRALASLVNGLSNVRAVLCIHSQGEVLYWNCGQEGELRAETLAFTEMIAARTGYEIRPEQNNDASFSDWCALEKGLIAVTVETGLGACPLEISQFSTIWTDNFDLLVRSAAYLTATP